MNFTPEEARFAESIVNLVNGHGLGRSRRAGTNSRICDICDKEITFLSIQQWKVDWEQHQQEALIKFVRSLK